MLIIGWTSTKMSSEEVCSFCLQYVTTLSSPRRLPCKHLACLDCLKEWMSLHDGAVRCPQCRWWVVIDTPLSFSLPPSVPPSLPPCHPPILPPCHPTSLPPYLPTSQPPCLPASLRPSVPPYLPPCFSPQIFICFILIRLYLLLG